MAKKSSKAYVTIGTDKSIRVTCGLQYEDVTNKDAHVPDRLRVLEKWSKFSILIKKGSFSYPAEVAEWPSVKALAAQGILTIGVETDEPSAQSTNAAEMKELIKEIHEELSPLEEASKEVPAEEPAKGE